jgi:hypothetical protein
VRAFAVHGVRTDVMPQGAEAQLEEFVAAPDLRLLALVHGGDMPGDADTVVREARHAARIAFENLRMDTLPSPPIFEIGNEPTAGSKRRRWPPETFGKAVAAAARVVWEIGGPETLVVSGGIHNPDRERQDYLRRAAAFFPPPDEARFAVGFHDYAPGMGDPDVPHAGFRTREDQIGALQRLGWPLFDTESGGHTGPREGHTDAQVAQWLTRRLDQGRGWGLVGTVVYQLDDGPDPRHHEDCFGLRRLDGSEKPSGLALRTWMRAAVSGRGTSSPRSSSRPRSGRARGSR